MLKRNKTIETIWSLIGGLIIGILLTNPLLAATGATFSASCIMPSYVAVSDGEDEQIAPDAKDISQDMNAALQKEVEKIEIQEEANVLQAQEAITLPDSNLGIVNTIFAK